MDAQHVMAALADEARASEVFSDYQIAVQMGVESVPTFVGGRLGAQRHAQKYMRVICRTRSPGDGVRGLDASLRWDSVTRSFPLVSEMS